MDCTVCIYDCIIVVSISMFFFRVHILRDGTIMGSIYVVGLPDRFDLDFRVYLVMPTDGGSWCSGTVGICQVSCNLVFNCKIYVCSHGV